jgi:hypothetical protein
MDTLIKSPIERFPVHFNFSVDLLAAETVITKIITCINSATGVDSSAAIIDSEAIVSPEVNVVIKGGTEGDEHSIQCVATTNLGNVFDRDLLLMVRTVVDDSFSKQPSDAILFDVDFSRRLETGDTVFSGAVLATKESDGTDVSATVAPLVEVITPRVGVHVAAGTDGATYLLGVRATTVAGYVYEKNIRMTTQEIP